MSEEKTGTGTAVATKAEASIAVGSRGLELKSIEDAYRLARYVVASGFAPKGMEKPETVLIAMQQGAEIGLTPMQSLQSIAVINGRPGIYGDAALALVRGSGHLAKYEQAEIGTPGKDDHGYKVLTVRKDGSKIETRFTVADAKAAGLWGKAGPWSQYPARMLLFRARGFNLRDNFGDVLKGLRTTAELEDMPPETIEAEYTEAAAGPKPERGADALARKIKPKADKPAPEAKPEGWTPTPEEQAEIEKRERGELL